MYLLKNLLACRFLLWAIALTGLVMLSSCSTATTAQFTPPKERPTDVMETEWPKHELLTLAYHDIKDGPPDQTFLSVSTDQLINQLAWLRENDFKAVSVDQVLAAHNEEQPLPEKPVLLTFDDGYKSFYTRVYPILKAYQWPAVLAPVGKWMDTPPGKKVDFGGLSVERNRFLNWQEVSEMSKSGLIEIAAHTNDLHFGTLANPQGNKEPAASSYLFNAQTQTYETPKAYQQRLSSDARTIAAKIEKATGQLPRVWVWPYGSAGGTALQILAQEGYSVAMTLENGAGTVNELMNMPRMLLANAPGTDNFASQALRVDQPDLVRVAHIDLDYLYDPDPAQMDTNLGLLVQRIADLEITTVFLQAYADPAGDGLVKSVYFPNRWLPVRADIFNRVAWQLRNRAKVKVYAWMPVLSFDLGPELDRVARWEPGSSMDSARPDPKQYQRLSPFNVQAREQIIEIYEDLARYAHFDGILFHDDALLGDFEDASPSAISAYQRAGLPGNIEALRSDPALMRRWTRLKTETLNDFTMELANKVKAVRGPQIKTARNIFAMPILQPESEAWFAQNLDDFLALYDYTAPMAMPYMEGVAPDQANQWLTQIVNEVAKRPGALERTVFEIQARDWSKPDSPFISGTVMASWLETLQLAGAKHFGYYPDDFIANHPPLAEIRPAISASWYPYP
ncbi:MAG: poly-beta-1,6-N-acetyl-D-glucosamine N-deacetylase [Pusillimonas sp.]|nr:poly-beta-1,6-N-acetyl-D-glucosamine N-deacetylase [Pusillimonas sp.]